MTTPKIAVVTGAGSGVGHAASISLATHGWFIVAVGRREEPLRETVAAIRGTGSEAVAISADVADASSVSALFDSVRADYGRLDLLFNNAATGLNAEPIETIALEEWQRVIDVNLTGSFLFAQAEVAQMKRQDSRGSCIINNGSISAQVLRPDSVAYTVSKHAITGLTKSFALDGRAYDISCGQIDIENALTEMTVPMLDGVVQADGSAKPEPTMDAADVGRAVAYMASLPPDANVPSLTVMANRMPFVGRG